jgi:hypothetical protein
MAALLEDVKILTAASPPVADANRPAN